MEILAEGVALLRQRVESVTMSIVKYKVIWFSVSGVMVLSSLVLLAMFGLRLGIDFTGGSILEVEFDTYDPVVGDVRGALSAAGFEEGIVQPVDEHGIIVRQKTLSEEKHQALLDVLGTFGTFEEKRFDSIGPIIGNELKRKSVWALLLIFVTIAAYVAFAFRKVSHYVKSWKYGVITIVAALHDVLIPIGVFALIGHVLHVEVGTAFVAALLTILGYSVNDTIVVFDRIRENLIRESGSIEEIVDQSVTQTFARSINTTLTTLLALVAVFFFGGETTRMFVLALMIGIGVGAYSSIFLASPLLVVLESRRN